MTLIHYGPKINFTPHALKRAQERGIDKNFLLHSLKFPDQVSQSDKNKKRILIKKIYYNQVSQKEHLLMIIGEKSKDRFIVITIIDTSKITKYF